MMLPTGANRVPTNQEAPEAPTYPSGAYNKALGQSVMEDNDWNHESVTKNPTLPAPARNSPALDNLSTSQLSNIWPEQINKPDKLGRG
jgi:hypothetical protein